MANYKKKNGTRKREKTNGFRWIKDLASASGRYGSYRFGGKIRRFVRQSFQAFTE